MALGLSATPACTLLSDNNQVPVEEPGFNVTAAADPLIVVAAGDIAGCSSFYKDEATAALIQQEPTAIALALGDLAYPDGTVAEYNCYHASWGQFRDRTYPTPGNHDYHQPGAGVYFDYFNGAGVDSGRAGHRARGNYAFDYGTWRIIVLNSELDIPSQTTWLQAELAANPRECSLAFWHRPFYSSNNTSPPSILKPWWDALLAGRVEIALQASHHYYERFAPQNSTSGATASGVRSFVVGTGGAGVGTVDIVPKVNSEKLILRTHGVLVLKLFADKYSYEFRRIDGTAMDAGEAPCVRGQALPPPPSSSTIQLAVTGREDATTQYMTLTWSGANGASVDVYRNGALIKTTENDGRYTNSRVFQGTITYVYRLCEAGTSTCSNEASASFGQPPPNVSPAAAFESSCTGLSCSFTDRSTDSDGRVTAWSWNFGDGGTSTSPNPSHTYATAGPYEVILTVTDDDGATAFYNQAITVAPTANQPPSAAFNAACTGFACSFTDQSTDDQGTLAQWTWTFGDGERAATQNPGHTYTAEGTYDVTLTVTDQAGETGTLTKSVTVTPPPPNTPPSASFGLSCTGLTCTFTDQSTDDGTILSWSWTFGDEESATVQSPTHTYAATGSYEVTLIVADDHGETGTLTRTVTVTAPPNAPPSAGFGFSCSGLTCAFTDQSTDADGTVASWSWTFGDGGTTTDRSPGHTYATAGTYTATLTVTDDDGATSAVSKQIAVSAPPSIVLRVTGRADATTQYMTLNWTGASGAMVDVYRNGTKIKTTENDGHYTNTRSFVGAATYTYRLCQSASTICSNNATVTFK
ncbi:MAG TPA: PKD domain-containing protein [Gemmatimonadales bacterium]